VFEQILVGVVLLIIYIGIAFEKLDRSVTALAGAAFLILAGVIAQEEAIEHIDGNTIILLIGMMVVVGIVRTTGLFEWMAVHAVKISGGDPKRIMISLIWVTALLSAILDNVTTVLLIAPITLSICSTLRLNPLPFLITEAMASNIGGIATLIGDPPNIMIGSAVKLTFVDFLLNLTPIVLVLLFFFTITCLYLFRSELRNAKDRSEAAENLREESLIKDHKLLRRSSIILGLMLLGFLLQKPLGIESASIALAGAAALLIASRIDPEKAYHEVHWTTLFFFIGLFIVVGAAQKVGIIGYIAEWAKSFVQAFPELASVFTVSISALASSVMDNIPFTATMIPVIKQLESLADIGPLWWALALGAGLGGNGTLIASSANLVVSGIAAKHGYAISFMYFLKYGILLMLESVIIAAVYMYFRY
jgi:Na+/H+ antiporter NhaD/arsenite permease-like protein